MTVIDNYTKVMVYDLSEGKVINNIELNKDIQRLPYTDIYFVNASATNLTYIVMSNKEIKVFENNKEKWALQANSNETLVFVGYDSDRKSVIKAAVVDGTEEVRSQPINGELKPFVFSFNIENDILLRTWQYALIVRTPPHSKTTMIIAHRVSGREMLFNEIEREIGEEFQVIDIFAKKNSSKTLLSRQILSY